MESRAERSPGPRARERRRRAARAFRGSTTPFPTLWSERRGSGTRATRRVRNPRRTHGNRQARGSAVQEHLLPGPCPPQYLYPGREPARRGAGPGAGGGDTTSREAPPRPGRPRPPARPSALPAPGPRLRPGPRPAAGCGDWLEGGPPCGKRRHGRSCSVNESKCLGDRGLPGGRHAKGGGGGGEKRAGEGGGEKSQSCSNSVSSTRDVHLPRRARSKGFETD